MSLLLATGSSSSGPPPEPWVRRQVADGCGPHRDTFNGTILAGAKSLRLRLNVRRFCREIQVAFGAPLNSWSIQSAALEVNGTLFPLYFGGGRGATIPYQGFVNSDVVSITIAPTDVVWVRYSPYGSPAPNASWAAGGMPSEPANGNLVDTPTWVTPGFGLYPVLPAELTALTDPTGKSFLVLGDSITEGGNDNLGGWAQRGLRDQLLPYVNAGTWAQSCPAIISTSGVWTATGLAQLGPSQLAPYTHAICAYGTNDFALYPTSQIQTQFTALWASLQAAGLTVAQRTIPPRTTSTDSWATLANQTVTAQESVRLALNAWIRTNPAGVTCIDSAAALEQGGAGAPTGKWRVDAGVLTTDGVHPEPAGHVLMKTALLSWLGGL